MSEAVAGGTVRTLGPADAAAAIALWRGAGLTRAWNDPAADYAAALATPDAVLLGLEEGSALVGTVMVGWDGHRGWLYYLAVAPDRRREGVGRALVAAAEAWLRERGAPKAQLMVRDDNPAASGFWRALGYERQPVAVMGRWLGEEPCR